MLSGHSDGWAGRKKLYENPLVGQPARSGPKVKIEENQKNITNEKLR